MKFPILVEGRLNEMDAFQRRAFMDEYKRRRKSISTGYILLLLLGWHYAYVGKWGSQLLCWVTLWGFFLWWIIDWFRLPSIIKRYNNDLSVKIMTEVTLIYGTVSQIQIDRVPNDMQEWFSNNPGKGLNDYYRSR